MLPKKLYHRLFTKMWLELETSSLYITDSDKKTEQKCQHVWKLSKAGAMHVSNRERERKEKENKLHHI